MTVPQSLPATSAPPRPDRVSGSLVAARCTLWLAIIVPFVFTTAKNASDVTGGVGALEVVRGAGPAGLWVLSMLFARTVRRGFGAVELCLAAFCLVIVMSMWVPENPSPHSTLLKAVSTVFVFLAMGRLVRVYRDPAEVVRGLIGFVHVVLLSAAVQLVLFHNRVYASDPTSLDTIKRLNSVVPQVSANPLATIAVCGILSCVLGVGPRWVPLNIVTRNLLVVLYFAEILLTKSRVALAVGLVVILCAIVVRIRRRPLSTLAILIAALGAVAVLAPSLAAKVDSYATRGQTTHGIDTLSGRTVIWHAAEEVWKAHQVFGLGYYSGHRLGIPGLSQVQSNIDNTWLETLVDVGLVGLVPLALFTVLGLVRLMRRSGLSGDLRLWAYGTAVFSIVISFINPSIQTPGPGQVVLGLLLLAAGPRLVARRQATGPQVDSTLLPAGDLPGGPGRTAWMHGT